MLLPATSACGGRSHPGIEIGDGILHHGRVSEPRDVHAGKHGAVAKDHRVERGRNATDLQFPAKPATFVGSCLWKVTVVLWCDCDRNADGCAENGLDAAGVRGVIVDTLQVGADSQGIISDMFALPNPIAAAVVHCDPDETTVLRAGQHWQD